jgi:fatty-acyl-CoA synthase
MGPLAVLQREGRYLSGLVRTLLWVRSIAANSTNLVCDDLERAADRWRGRPAITFEGETLTYGGLDERANRYAHWAIGQGLKRGASVAILLPNRLDYLPLWYGLTKVGVVAALINNQLAGEALAHCLNISGADHCILDATTAAAFETATPLLDRPVSGRAIEGLIEGQGGERPDRSTRVGLTAKDTALLIYTSGTTGLPKAARITHMRAQLYMRGFAGATGARPSDRIYVTLPLYHATGGLCAMGAALLTGACALVRDGFSASHFWDEVASERATMFVYIGELCRYLANQPIGETERAHKLRLAFGNGLGRDVWATLEDRFGVPRILEFYGSTEGNVSMFNFDGTRGALGRVAPYLASLFNITLVRFDVEKDAPERGADGLCIACAPGEIGECLGAIEGGARTEFAGYVDKAASEKKVLRGAFKAGDAWFRTGDLMTRDGDGYFYFVDRIGDTFRWKGENVSTTEVAQALLAAPGVKEAIVYGVAVPHHDGRAGMAALVTDDGFDLAALRAHVEQALPPYAQPLFLRLAPSLATTGTFKPRKVDLIAQGFDPAKVESGLYFDDAEVGFIPVTAEVHARIISPETKL